MRVSQKSLVLLDGYNLLHRGCAVPSVGGASYIIRNILRFRRDFTHGAVIFDTPSSRDYRRGILQRLSGLSDGVGYKALREAKTSVFVGELKKARAAVQKLGLSIVDAVGVEADDVLFGLARRAETAKFGKVLIVTGDHDLYAAISQITSVTDGKSDFSIADFTRIYSFSPTRYADYMAFIGKHDQVPGVRGIGPATANVLLRDFYDLCGVLSADDADVMNSTSPAVVDLLRQNANTLWLGRALARLHVPKSLPDVDSLVIGSW